MWQFPYKSITMNTNISAEKFLNFLLERRSDDRFFECNECDLHNTIYNVMFVYKVPNSINTEEVVNAFFTKEVNTLSLRIEKSLIILAKANDQLNENILIIENMNLQNRFISIVDSRWLHSVDELFSRIKSMFDYNRMYDLKQGINYINQVDVVSTIIEQSEIQYLLHLFEKGCFSKLEERINIDVEQIRKKSAIRKTSFPPTSIKRFFVEFITYALHATYDYGVDVDEILKYQDPYQIIFSFDETPDIKNWCIKICKKLYDASQQAISTSKSNLISSIENYILNNLSRNDLSVNEIAETFHLSPAYLSSCYSTLRGQTIIKFIGQSRLSAAQKYLEQSKLTISEICEKVGYSSERYFYSCFKNEFGITPSEYRKNKQ